MEAGMQIGVLGTGTVRQKRAGKLVELGHEVRIGSRDAGNEKAAAWAEQAGELASTGTFADAAGFGELVLNATAGVAALDALRAAGAENLAGKTLIDVSNPLDFSQGMPPRLSVCNDDSVAEQIQREFADARVVKAFNTMPNELMVNPGALDEDHTLLLAGNDADAKRQLTELAQSLGRSEAHILDLGDVTAARGMEMFLPLWLRLMGASGGRLVTVKVVSG